jgi:hypothetical protein
MAALTAILVTWSPVVPACRGPPLPRRSRLEPAWQHRRPCKSPATQDRRQLSLRLVTTPQATVRREREGCERRIARRGRPATPHAASRAVTYTLRRICREAPSLNTRSAAVWTSSPALIPSLSTGSARGPQRHHSGQHSAPALQYRCQQRVRYNPRRRPGPVAESARCQGSPQGHVPGQRRCLRRPSGGAPAW